MTFTGEPELELERMAGSRFAVTGSSPESTRLAQSIVEAVARQPQIPRYRLYGLTVPVLPTDPRNRLHNQHPYTRRLEPKRRRFS